MGCWSASRVLGEVLSIAYAGAHQHQDAGAKMIHLAPETTSRIISKSISKDGGRTSYRGIVHIGKGARGAKTSVVCDASISKVILGRRGTTLVSFNEHSHLQTGDLLTYR